jgi:Flp pilus assembly protein TadD
VIRTLFRATAPGLTALLLLSATAGSAQMAERPADRLSRHLRTLAADPTSLTALIGAGEAALDVGDGNAALGFFARADERAPRNGQVKAGLARALLMVDNPRQALKMFDAARSLGVSDAQLAPDRGLAYDLKGDTKRAQQDYALALGRGANDEVTKRYALSLGISGDRDQALKLLDPLLYKRDQGAWRARAFVLAMTGDTAGASKIVHQVMPARMAQTMDPFLLRLASLNAAQKAAAVHLGEMPGNGRTAPNAPQITQPQPSYTPAPAFVARRERPQQQQRVTTANVQPAPPQTVVQVARTEPIQSALLPGRAGPPAAPAEQRGDLEAIMRNIRSAASEPSRPRLAQVTVREAPAPKPTPKAAPPVAKAKEAVKPEPKKVAVVKDEPEKPGKKLDAKATKADPKSAKAVAAAKKKPEPPKHPARIWVQVAGGANKDALPKAWSGLSSKAADLKSKGPWTAKNRATNRLLAGPFKSEDEAQAAVAKLRKAGVGAFQWRSEEGETVEKIGAK